eukprot:2754308-Alexandrium_andersonii.AAC.1
MCIRDSICSACPYTCFRSCALLLLVLLMLRLLLLLFLPVPRGTAARIVNEQFCSLTVGHHVTKTATRFD